jgi:alkanesulfonate monooxygenase SsuD/methylene tetrahydromethanopterin reductase-like flavin-dependent oxidoreductase (luciferase family)
VRICLMIEGQEDVTWDDWVSLARACEESGLEGLFRSDHYASVVGDFRRGALDAWSTLAALATRTEQIRLGSMVSPATFRHPSVLAKAVVTADHVSGGRVELGMGAGWHEREHSMYGFSFPERSVRVERFAEQVEIVHRQWTEEAFDFDGRHYRLEDCRALPKPVQNPHPPLIIGGSGGRGRSSRRFAGARSTTRLPLRSRRWLNGGESSTRRASEQAATRRPLVSP